MATREPLGSYGTKLLLDPGAEARGRNGWFQLTELWVHPRTDYPLGDERWFIILEGWSKRQADFAPIYLKLAKPEAALLSELLAEYSDRPALMQEQLDKLTEQLRRSQTQAGNWRVENARLRGMLTNLGICPDCTAEGACAACKADWDAEE